MTDFDDTAVLQSWERVAAEAGDQLPLRFYAILFRAHPELRPMFPFDMSELRDKLFRTIDVILKSVNEGKIGSKIPAIRNLGVKHAQEYSVLKEHYPMVGGALLAALEYYDPEWNEELFQQWSLAYGIVAEVMLEGAAA